MLSIQVESFMDNIEDFETLTGDHYEELALNKDKVPLSPAYDAYNAYENEGRLVFVTCRDKGVLVGYFVGFVGPGLHYSTCMTCTMDLFYVARDYRGQGAGKKIFDFLQRELKARKVDRWFVGSKLHADIGPFFKQFGFEPIETHYSKWIGD